MYVASDFANNELTYVSWDCSGEQKVLYFAIDFATLQLNEKSLEGHKHCILQVISQIMNSPMCLGNSLEGRKHCILQLILQLCNSMRNHRRATSIMFCK